VTARRATHRLATLYRVLGVSPSGYYAWRQRPISARARADVILGAQIPAIHTRSRGTCGVPRVHAELAAGGVHVGRKRVARLMRAAGVQGVGAGSTGPPRTGIPRRRPIWSAAPSRRPGRIASGWPTSPTSRSGRPPLSRRRPRCVESPRDRPGDGHPLRTELVLDALNMAVAQRRPIIVIHPSDQGCQYSSLTFGLRCREAGVRPSMGRVGDAYDNALCESVFATLECERLDPSRPRPRPGWPSSTSSRAGTIRTGGIPVWTICRRSAMNNGIPSSPSATAVHRPRNRGNSTPTMSTAQRLGHSSMAGVFQVGTYRDR
jgi:putative transposase